MTTLDIEFSQSGTTLSFKADDESTSFFVLPLTYYKGYQVYEIDGADEIPVETFESSNGLVACKNEGSGLYVCRYVDTPLRTGSLITSFTTLMMLCVYQFYIMKSKKEDHA